jgi:hypothetical protein
VIRLRIGRSEDPVAFRRAAIHAHATARSGSLQYQAADEIRFRKRYLLRHEAADRKTQHVDLLQPECLDECDGVACHLFKRGRNLARPARDAGVVEQNDLSFSREAIGHRRIPMVHRPGEVLVENEGYAIRLPEATIGDPDAVRLDELRRRGLVGMNHYSTLPRMRSTDVIKREGESIGRWCRRYVGISRRDERRSQFCFHQCVGQRSNLLAQLFEKVVNKRVGRPTTGIIAKWVLTPGEFSMVRSLAIFQWCNPQSSSSSSI